MIVIMRDAIMPDCCNTCVCSEGYGCGITGTIMTTKEMESRPDWCPLEEVEPCEDAVSRADVVGMLEMYPFTEYSEYEAAREVVKRLPSVTPKAQQRWIPCDWCAYNPPSSMDGKPCTVCPAVANPEPYREEGENQ